MSTKMTLKALPALIGGACLLIAASTASAGDLSKKAKKLCDNRGTDLVEVMVAYDQQPSKSESRRVGKLGGNMGRGFDNVPVQLISIPANKIDQLASGSGVRFVATDESVGSFSESARQTAGLPIVGEDNSWMPQVSYDVGVAIIDSGVETHSDLNNQAGFECRFTITAGGCELEKTAVDHFGHGTHVAGIAGGNGGFSAGQFAGVAEYAPVTSLRVLDDSGMGNVSDVIAALDWIITNGSMHSIRVVNMSLGKGVEESNTTDPLVLAAEAVWDAGFVVVVSAVNYGRDGNFTITSPGNSRKVITVGSLTDSGTGADFTDDYVSSYS